MSKFLPDPQLQSLKAMRAGDISMPTPATLSIGKQNVAIAQPIVLQSVSLTTSNSLQTLAGTPSESPVVGESTATLLSQDTLQSKSLVAIESLETVAGTPSESPVVGVTTGTSVI